MLYGTLPSRLQAPVSISSPVFIDRFSELAPPMTSCSATCGAWCTTASPRFPEAGEALARFRKSGGTVVLISNAPRPGRQVVHFLDHLGVIRDGL